MKKCCKDFLDAAEDSFTYQHVSLDKFPLIPWLLDDKRISFLERCKESKNMDMLYTEGLLQYFKGSIIGDGGCGIELLKIVAEKGHREAKYVYGMIMLCSENEELRKHGLKYIRFLRESKCVIQCRKNVEKILQYMWENNKKLMQNQKILCMNKSTCKSWRPKHGRWLLLEDEEDDNDNINMCEYCRWDHELKRVELKVLGATQISKDSSLVLN
ncbi:unnamed protein product [Lupinus luteus]|uniref:At2g35280-like TPR domain-containing protein n=1 Tax=Lupinus luteus TaxID=3873 RepID=A0AAV1Y9B2_LUPLU